MSRTNFKELLDAGAHFGHLKRKWNPNMSPYIFMEKNGIHIIDLQKTVAKIDIASSAMKQIAKSGRKILFVATKKQAKDIVADRIKQINMPYVTERWPGGMLTNFPTIRKAVKKMASIDKMASDGTFDTLSKRERLQIARQKAKLEKNLGSIADLTRLPAALFIVDISKEHIAVREAKRLNIPVFAIVNTNSDPTKVDFPIPANDDAAKSIFLIVDIVSKAIEEGLNERKLEKEKETDGKEKEKKSKKDDEKDTLTEETKEDAKTAEAKEETKEKQESIAHTPDKKDEKLERVTLSKTKETDKKETKKVTTKTSDEKTKKTEEELPEKEKMKKVDSKPEKIAVKKTKQADKKEDKPETTKTAEKDKPEAKKTTTAKTTKTPKEKDKEKKTEEKQKVEKEEK